MTEVVEKVAVAMHSTDNTKCPFCPGVKEKDWKTFKGIDNNGKILRQNMNNPTRCQYAHQSGARPKDNDPKITDNKPDPENQSLRQSPDGADTNPVPSIFHKDKYGHYGNEAHHCISGNEIMKGHRIEKVISQGALFQGDTGYTINTAANGVYLPSYPLKYKGIWGKYSFPKTYPVFDKSEPITVRSEKEDNDFKYSVMKAAMQAGKGQAHIGNHKDFIIETLPEFQKSYPDAIKAKLDNVIKRVVQEGKKCPYCIDSKGKKQKPFIPPYRVNQWLDNLSKEIKVRLKSSPDVWPYFISKLARDYFVEVRLPELNRIKKGFMSK